MVIILTWSSIGTYQKMHMLMSGRLLTTICDLLSLYLLKACIQFFHKDWRFMRSSQCRWKIKRVNWFARSQLTHRKRISESKSYECQELKKSRHVSYWRDHFSGWFKTQIWWGTLRLRDLHPWWTAVYWQESFYHKDKWWHTWPESRMSSFSCLSSSKYLLMLKTIWLDTSLHRRTLLELGKRCKSETNALFLLRCQSTQTVTS